MPRSFRIEQTFAAATEPGEDLKTNLDARAPGFGAESVSDAIAPSVIAARYTNCLTRRPLIALSRSMS
jgi:hypothetical protein